MSSDAVTLFLGLLVGGLGMLTVVLLTLFVVGSWLQYAERERRYDRERNAAVQPPVIYITQQPQLPTPPPNRVLCDPQGTYADDGASYPVGAWRWLPPVEVRR